MNNELKEVIEQEENQNQIGNIIPFGIACFHFGIAKEPPFRYSDEQYIAELRKALESIPNIEQISITEIVKDQTTPQDISEKIPDIHEADGFFPNWGFGKVEFSIHIPERIQRQILPFLDVCTERFKISINYSYHMPVTFVVPVNPTGECCPADAVIVIREFLELQFINIKSEYIRFEYLGPSPFHADCYLKPGECIGSDGSSPGFISRDVTTEIGYDELIINYDTKIFENRKDVEACFFKEIISELSFFYGISRIRAIKLRKWVQIEEMLEEIIPKNTKKGIWRSFRESISYSGKIKKLFIAIAIFEKDLIFIKEEIRHDYEDIYSDRWTSYFQKFIDSAMREEETYPTKELIQLLSYLEDKRAKNMELLTMFFSAIIGGGIGALITLLLAK